MTLNLSDTDMTKKGTPIYSITTYLTCELWRSAYGTWRDLRFLFIKESSIKNNNRNQIRQKKTNNLMRTIKLYFHNMEFKEKRPFHISGETHKNKVKVYYVM